MPHFNVSDLDQLRGVAEAAAKLQAPVMIGTSEGERKFIGLRSAVALIKAYRQEFGIPIFLNADHTKSVKAAKIAIEAGYDSVHIDLSREPYELNVMGTRALVRYARRQKKRINVEGELGYLVTESSQVYRKQIRVDPATLTDPEEAVRFVKATGIDRLAPAVGNLHGIAANRPRLDWERIKKLRRKLPPRVALVLHGGSGNSPAAFKKAIRLGVNNIHISTELRLADTRALRKYLRKYPKEIAPYKFSEPSKEAVRKKAEDFIKIFGASHRS